MADAGPITAESPDASSFCVAATRICIKCDQPKPLSRFERDARSRNHIRKCMDCRYEEKKASPAWRAYTIQYEKTPHRREKSRRLARKRRYGLDHSTYETIFAQQGGKCAICEVPHKETLKGRLRVDHDHSTGIIRGLLCDRCNVSLGQMGDTLPALEKFFMSARDYLIRQPSPNPQKE